MVNLNVSIRQNPSERTFLRLENIAGELSIAELKNVILAQAGLDNQCHLGISLKCFKQKVLQL